MKIFRVYLKNKETKYHMACDKIKFRDFELQFILPESSRKGEGNGEIFRFYTNIISSNIPSCYLRSVNGTAVRYQRSREQCL